MPLPEREGRLPAVVGRPLRFARRAVAYALRHEFQGQLDEIRALIVESNAYTSRQLDEVEAFLGWRGTKRDGQHAVDLLSPRGLAVAYAFRALGGLAAEARVLDLAPQSTAIAFALASLGCKVSAVSSLDIGYRHPNLTLYDLEDGQLEGRFAAILAVLPNDSASLTLMRRFAQPGTLLVAAVELPAGPGVNRSIPLGPRPLPGWRIEDRSFAETGLDGHWTVVERRAKGRPALALITAQAV